MSVPSAYMSSSAYADHAAILPYLQPREVDTVLDAIGDQRLVPVARDGEIIALAVPEVADRIVADGDRATADQLYSRLRETADELASLRATIGEVFAEKEPADFAYRLHDAGDDVQRALDAAIDTSEDRYYKRT